MIGLATREQGFQIIRDPAPRAFGSFIIPHERVGLENTLNCDVHCVFHGESDPFCWIDNNRGNFWFLAKLPLQSGRRVMTIKAALAGIAVFNLEESLVRYERLLGRPQDRRPMDNLAEWRFASGGEFQVFEDSERGGTSSVTLVDTDIDERISELKKQKIDIRSVSNSAIARICIIGDPDGNQIVFAQSHHQHRAVA